MNWTVETVLSFAPDTGTANRGKKLANSKKWVKLEKNDRAIWGNCKGSGSSLYETGVDFNGPAFKCTCPVRKPPCKHVMGLMLSYANKADSFDATEAPTWMSTWLGKQDARTSKPTETAKPKDDAAAAKAEATKAKNREKRLKLMQDGLQDLEIWMSDLLRQGLANVEKEPYTFWQNMATRMVDSKVRGVAGMIKELPLLINSKTDWPQQILTRLGEIHLYIKAFQQLDKLPKPLQSTILQIGGINPKKSDLMQEKGIADDWMTIGKREGTDLDGNLKYRRVWLWGINTGRPAVIMDYVPQHMSFEHHYAIGTVFKGEVVYYPGILPLRVLVKKQYPAAGNVKDIVAVQDFNTFLGFYAKSVAAHPWLLEYPCPIKNVIPIMQKDGLIFVDQNNTIIPVSTTDEIGWKLLALSGGHPINIFGEWSGELLVPLSASINSQFIPLQ